MITYREYLDYSDQALLAAKKDNVHQEWLMIASTTFAWSAIESFVNNMLDDFASLPSNLFELHERALLLEQKLRFVDRGAQIGLFILEGKEYRRLEDKILFLITKFGGKDNKNIKGETLWQEFENLKNMRDALIHPRRSDGKNLDIEQVEGYIETAKSVIQLVSRNVWKKDVVF